MKNYNNSHAGRPGRNAFVATERTTNESVKSPVILPDELLCSMDRSGLNAYMESLCDYVVALGGKREHVDAIFRTSILIGLMCMDDIESAIKNDEPNN